MKAMTQDRYGSPDVLTLREVPIPKPTHNQLLVKVRKSSVTSGDTRLRAFQGAGLLLWLPMRLMFGIFGPRKPIVGMEFSGDIVAIGENVVHFSIGQPVFGTQLRGCNAEYLSISEDAAVLPKPKRLSHQQATAIPFGSLAALVFLRDIAKVKQGENILIYGASGNVGLFAIQLCRYFGATVTAVCSTENIDLVKSVGANFTIDYKKEDFTKNHSKYDVIFDAVGKASFWKSRNSLTKFGRYVYIGLDIPSLILSLSTALLGRRRFLVGISGDTKLDLQIISNLIDRDFINPVIDREYALTAVPEAHHYVERGRKTGSVIIDINGA